MLLKVKQDLKSQAKVETIEQVGTYRGEYHNFGYHGDAGTTTSSSIYNQDSFIVYDYMPVIGGTKQVENNYLVVNVLNEFVKARAANTSIAKYSSIDVAKWLISAGGINALNGEIIRAFKSLSLGDNKGRQQRLGGLLTVPMQTLTGATNAIANNVADYLAYYNRIIKKLDGIKIPKGVPFIDYWYKLSSKMWREDQTDKSQNFYFRARVIPQWDVNGTFGTVGSIVYRKLGSSSNISANNELKTMLDLLNELADVYTTDDDINNMFAEFARANMSEVYSFKQLTEQDILTGLKYELDIDVIQAVKNMRLVPISMTEMLNIVLLEKTNNIGALHLVYHNNITNRNDEFEFTISEPHPNYGYNVADVKGTNYANRLLLLHNDDANEDEIFNAMQFSPTIERATSGVSDTFKIRSAGLAIIVGMKLMTGAINNGVAQSSAVIQSNYLRSHVSGVNWETVFTDLLTSLRISNNDALELLQFTAIPVFYLSSYSTTSTATTKILVDDCDNTIVKSTSIYEKVHDAICMSEVSYDARRKEEA